MASSDRFQTGFLLLDQNEEVFLSVTPGFEAGPGIQRDGITPPRMTDPHGVAAVLNHFGLTHPKEPLPPTTDAFLQRAGTWTLYHHLKSFHERYGREWLIVGVQSNGDLTMNPWHIAYISPSQQGRQGTLCGLLTDNDPQEPIGSRIYRCLVKWNTAARQHHERGYDCINLRIEGVAGLGRAVKIHDKKVMEAWEPWMTKVPGYQTNTKDIAPLIEFAVAGKPVVEDDVELPLANAIDRFEDVRHIFALPSVNAVGFYNQHVSRVNFGEYQLYGNLNERRAALSSPVIIDLNIDGRVTSDWSEVRTALLDRHFRETRESPGRRGQFRRYVDQSHREKVEIFFPQNVYPFGVLGLQSTGQIVCLSSGGLSGKLGNTLEGIGRIMFDFFGCIEAMVLDEGFDVFFITNPKLEANGKGVAEDRAPQRAPARYRFSNEEILARVLAFTRTRVERDAHDYCAGIFDQSGKRKGKPYLYGDDMTTWPLNRNLFEELEQDAKAGNPEEDYADVLLVQPRRSQMRSVLIFARRLERSGAPPAEPVDPRVRVRAEAR